MQIDLAEATAKLPELVQAAEHGEEVAITRDGQLVAKIVAIAAPDRLAKKRVFGALKGRISIGSEFFEPLPEDELALWNSEED
jgi:prevent-host-death family protein